MGGWFVRDESKDEGGVGGKEVQGYDGAGGGAEDGGGGGGGEVREEGGGVGGVGCQAVGVVLGAGEVGAGEAAALGEDQLSRCRGWVGEDLRSYITTVKRSLSCSASGLKYSTLPLAPAMQSSTGPLPAVS